MSIEQSGIEMNNDNWGDERENFIESIDFWCFQKYSPDILDWCKCSNRKMAKILRFELTGTLFDMLPFEIFEYIIETKRLIYIEADRRYYIKYFSEEESVIVLHRYLRPTKEQRLKEKKSLPKKQTDIGTIKIRPIHRLNTASKCYEDIAKAIDMGVDSIFGLNNLYNALTNWLIWVCEHSYIPCWCRLMTVILEKIYEFNDSIYDIGEGSAECPKGFNTENDIQEAKDILWNMKYLVEDYLPYALLARSSSFFKVRENNGVPYEKYKELLYTIFVITKKHPNSINMQDVFEFEMATYAPSYYYGTYVNYMKLRNNKYIIPKGQIPNFYWFGNEYVMKFI